MPSSSDNSNAYVYSDADIANIRELRASIAIPGEPLSILDEAAAIVDGDREQTYGNPGKNLAVIAGFWSVWLAGRGGGGAVEATDVSIMMTLLKIARLANTPTHRDSQIDACGYMRLLERIQTESNN